MTAIKAAAALAMLFFCVYWVLIALWMYNDASKCRLSPLYWGLIGLFTNLIGLIVYKIYKRGMTVCPELRHCPEYGSPVLFLMRRAAWYSL